MVQLLLVIGAIFSAYQVMRSQRLLYSAMWLALTSALVSVLLYLLGAAEVAVMELSVGAGLVTVLFVFAFSIVGEYTWDDLTIVPRPLVWILILGAAGLLGWFSMPYPSAPDTIQEPSFAYILWQERGLDVLAQVVLIFAGVLGLLGLLSEQQKPVSFLNKETTEAVSINGENGNHRELEPVIEEAQR